MGVGGKKPELEWANDRYYDVKVGGGKAAEKGSRVAVSSSFLTNPKNADPEGNKH
jgi:hypothetical protein